MIADEPHNAVLFLLCLAGWESVDSTTVLSKLDLNVTRVNKFATLCIHVGKSYSALLATSYNTTRYFLLQDL